MTGKYTEEIIRPFAVFECQVILNNKTDTINMYVYNRSRPIFGQEWLRHFKLDWREFNSIHHDDQL